MKDANALIGRTITEVVREPYEGGTIVGFVLDNDETLFAYSDAEGNGAGAMMLMVVPSNGDQIHEVHVA